MRTTADGRREPAAPFPACGARGRHPVRTVRAGTRTWSSAQRIGVVPLAALAALFGACTGAAVTTQTRSPARAAAAPLPAVIDAGGVLADFELMRAALWAAHPRLFHYTDSAAVGQAFAAVRARLHRNMTTLEFYRLAAEAVAAIGDGHTQLQLPERAAPARVAPVELKIAGGRAWVMASYTEGGPAPGSEVLAINGTPIRDVLDLATRRMSRDWGLPSGKHADLSGRFAEYYADLVAAPAAYAFEVRTGRSTRVVRVPAIARDSARSLRRLRQDTLPIAWRMIADSVAYIDLNSFSDGNFEHVGRTFTASWDSAMALVRARGARRMILDLRQNGGGEASNGAYVVSSFLDRPFPYLTSITARTNELPVIAHTQWANDSAASQAEYRDVLRRRPDGRFDVVADWYSTAAVQPRSWTFAGPLYVITDGFVASTGSDVASVLHAHRRAAFVGETVGGSYDGNASGLAARIRLPASGVTLRVPLFDFALATGAPPDPSGAFAPDLTVHPDPAALVRGEDPVLDAALALAREERHAPAPFGPRLTAYFGALANNRDFQGVVLVRGATHVLYARPFGFSDLGARRPHDLGSRFGIASLTKTFTAAAILRLRDRGALALGDPLATYLPGFPNGRAITILQLLRHEAGLADLPEPAPDDTLTVPTAGQLGSAIAALPPLFAPGTDERYSNAGYTILARVVEVASHRSFPQFLADEFWVPLGMTGTGDRRSLATEADLARPYSPGAPPEWLDPLPRRTALTALGSGSLFATAGDLGRWGAMIAVHQLVDLAREPYPYGWGRATIEGRRGYEQSGSMPGYVSHLQVFPDADRIVVILSNVEHGSWTDWARDAARMVFGATDVRPVPRRAAFAPIDSTSARHFTGRFRMTADRYVDIAFEDGNLWLRLNGYRRRHYMLPTGEGRFSFRSFSGDVRFDVPAGDEPAPSFVWILPASWNQPDEIYRRDPNRSP